MVRPRYGCARLDHAIDEGSSLARSAERGPKAARTADAFEYRTEWERDYDRILFCTPVRRLADKTQVFPLERNDSVRNRLTHSHEVSNLARGMGTYLACHFDGVKTIENVGRIIPPILASAGLAHDLGNPPFGHQGEQAIRRWFKRNQDSLFQGQGEEEKVREDARRLTPAMKDDFLRFEGNAQTFRILSRLQATWHARALNLTYATLGSVMKYPVASDGVNETVAIRKKHGFFQSEKDVVNRLREQTGLSDGQRHPLGYLMEACDDIAYSVIDAEDAIKKELVSVSDLFAFLDAEASGDEIIIELVKFGEETHERHRKSKFSPAELNDITMQHFRAQAIGKMVFTVLTAFVEKSSEIMAGTFNNDIISASRVQRLCKAMKSFDTTHAYRHRSVLELELDGFNAIQSLMDMLWIGITSREDYSDPASKRITPFAAYAYGRISENYRRIFEKGASNLPIRYREMQLLTDMISGMTDSYALELCKELEHFYVGPSRDKARA